MGWHFINPKVTGFDIRKPPILVYNKRGTRWQLVAFEWVFPTKPAKPPLPGATYGSFGAACHYKDGTFVFKAAQDRVRADRARRPGRPSTSGIPTWSRSTSGSGTRTRTGSSPGMNPLMHPFNAG